MHWLFHQATWRIGVDLRADRSTLLSDLAIRRERLAVTGEKRSKAMNRQRLYQQMVCPGLVALLLIGCSGAQVTRPDSKQALFVISCGKSHIQKYYDKLVG